MTAATTRTLEISLSESRRHDWLRLFLLSQVVLGHMAAITLEPIHSLLHDWGSSIPGLVFRGLFRFGPQAACLFVFLSGYMVAGPLIRQVAKGSPTPAALFFPKRLRRIVPISFVALAITAVLDGSARALSAASPHVYEHTYSYNMLDSYNWSTLFGNLAFLQPTFSSSFGSNGPIWTLGYIVQFYVVGWALTHALSTLPMMRFGLLVALLLTLMAIASPEWLAFFAAWVLGGVMRYWGGYFRYPRSSLLLALLCIGCADAVSGIPSIALATAAGPLLVAAIRNPASAARTLGGDRLRRLSNDSYTVYAVHHPALMFVYAVGFSGHVDGGVDFLGYVLASLCAVAAASVACNQVVAFVERWVASPLKIGGGRVN